MGSVTHWQSTQSTASTDYLNKLEGDLLSLRDVDDMGIEDCLSWHGMQGLDTRPELQLRSTASYYLSVM